MSFEGMPSRRVALRRLFSPFFSIHLRGIRTIRTRRFPVCNQTALFIPLPVAGLTDGQHPYHVRTIL